MSVQLQTMIRASESKRSSYLQLSDQESARTAVQSDATSNLSKTSDKPEAETVAAEPQGPPPPPDGGVVAWLQVAAGMTVFMSTWGLINSFGIFQSYYATTLIPDTSDSSISWIGTIQICLVMAGSAWSGILTDFGYGHLTIVAGMVLVIFGMFMTSLCTQYWQLVLAQGLVIGIGMGSTFAPMTGIVNSYFTTKRGIALGLVATGSSVGGVVFPVVWDRLIDRLGFAWTTRVIAFILLGLLPVPIFVVRQRTKPATRRRLYDLTTFKEPDFVFFAASLFVAYAGAFVPLFYIQLYAEEQGIIVSDLNFYLLPILNAASLFGRPFSGWFADKIGAMNAYILMTAVSAVLNFGWIGVKNEAGVIVFILLYGFFSSGPIVLSNVILAYNLTPDIRHFGVRLTMAAVPAAIGVLIGNPIAGAILPHGWLGLMLFAAFTLLAGGALSCVARGINGGTKLLKKV